MAMDKERMDIVKVNVSKALLGHALQHGDSMSEVAAALGMPLKDLEDLLALGKAGGDQAVRAHRQKLAEDKIEIPDNRRQWAFIVALRDLQDAK